MSDRVTVDALALRARLEEQLGREANVQAQRIVDDLIREQARDGGGGQAEDELDLELVLNPRTGSRRQLHVYASDEPGVAYALEESEWTGCALRAVGRERLLSVIVDGKPYGVTSRVETGP